MASQAGQASRDASSDLALKYIMDASPVGILVFENDARVIFANSLAEKLFVNPLNLSQKDRCGDFILCRHRHSHSQGCGHGENCRHCALFGAIQRAFEEEHDGVLQEGEAFLERDSGLPSLWVQFKVRGILVEDRKVAVMAINDISAQKTSEKALQESEERFRKAFLSSPVPLVLSHIESGQFIDVNDQWEKMLGYSREEQIGRNSGELGIWKDPGERDRLVTILQEKGFFKDEPIKFLSRSGELIHARWTAEAIALGGRQVMLSMIFDETENKKLLDQLLQAQKLESIGRLAGGVAHDYNNMLSVIVGYGEMAMGRVQPDDPIHADLEEILNAAKRSADITRQLLAFARRQTIAPRVVDLNTMVGNMLKMLRRLIGEDIQVSWHPGRQLWPVKIDPAQVDQVLATLCVNAREAIKAVGKIFIETKNQSFDIAFCKAHGDVSPGDYVLLSVSDDGCGMDRETLHNIFEPFFTTKGLAESSGLGLAPVYGIVKQNDGFIHVYSEPGKGATFKIYLPRHEEARGSREPENKGNAPTGRGETILLVEDEPALLKLTATTLQRLGYEVLAAGTPLQALQLTGEHIGGIDLLLTDVIMPEMNGGELARELVTRFPSLKTLFMSGYTANVMAHRGVLNDGMRFIQKPFSILDLGLKVREALDDETIPEGL